MYYLLNQQLFLFPAKFFCSRLIVPLIPGIVTKAALDQDDIKVV